MSPFSLLVASPVTPCLWDVSGYHLLAVDFANRTTCGSKLRRSKSLSEWGGSGYTERTDLVALPPSRPTTELFEGVRGLRVLMSIIWIVHVD
ncbi:hypothetical protein BD310DRAFT_941951 [Dichomitus squalens]|uniref:Uncharacterized protein n=1 Tax=Dichomitus squalens TaxID=114155 RepID=A0A4Q9PAV2_9APHY|nr:hypothetical protein BD310DRAFT_941951 [Dichomitus squalens]